MAAVRLSPRAPTLRDPLRSRGGCAPGKPPTRTAVRSASDRGRLRTPSRCLAIKLVACASFIHRITRLRPVSMGVAAGLLVTGVLAIVGGSYAHDVVHDQLAPQKIFFPPARSRRCLPGVKQYAGQQVDTAREAKAYANDFIDVHLTKIAGGKTYAEVSGVARGPEEREARRAEARPCSRARPCAGCCSTPGAGAWSAPIATHRRHRPPGLGAVLFLLPAAGLAAQRPARRRRNAAPPRPTPVASA